MGACIGKRLLLSANNRQPLAGVNKAIVLLWIAHVLLGSQASCLKNRKSSEERRILEENKQEAWLPSKEWEKQLNNALAHQPKKHAIVFDSRELQCSPLTNAHLA